MTISNDCIHNTRFSLLFTRIQSMLDALKSIFGGGTATMNISAQELRQRLKSPNKPVLLDVRQPAEHRTRNIPGSMLIPLGELQNRMSELDKHRNREIVVYCASGGRSSSACRLLSQAGFTVINLSGGMMSWA
jgi:rhodanese-related sulfurtransferase